MAGKTSDLIIPKTIPTRAKDQERLDVWGFADSGFTLNAQAEVRFSGTRYGDLCGNVLPTMFPWFCDVVESQISPTDLFPEKYPPAPIPEALNTQEFQKILLKNNFKNTQFELDAEQRLRRGHGHTVEEMHAIKHEGLPRIPDLIVFPENDEQVLALVEAAKATNCVLIPYGGGTNVTDALRCPIHETRPIVSVDMVRMNQVLWIDAKNHTACIQAGAVGRHIIEQLAAHGFTLGHEPDSIEFSTMGGWIATNASGMKKNRYGNIEHIVLDVNFVSAQGLATRSAPNPRESIGLNAKGWILGSEGNLGIITSAIVKIHPLPECQEYGSILFKNFANGVAFMEDLERSGQKPASVRLMDNLQFQFGHALKPASTGLKAQKSKAEKLLITKILGFDVNEMTAATLVFEGGRDEVNLQKQTVYKLAKKHGGFKAGGENGRRGYQLTYGIAYIRDFVMRHHIMAESFETSVPWSRAAELCDKTKAAIYAEHIKRGLPGKPFVSCRVTQLYETGVCVYFYFAYYAKGVADPIGEYHAIEDAARQAILNASGSLSHHHGIGKLRAHFVPQIMSPAHQAMRDAVKNALDPQNIFGVNNLAACREPQI